MTATINAFPRTSQVPPPALTQTEADTLALFRRLSTANQDAMPMTLTILRAWVEYRP